MDRNNPFDNTKGTACYRGRNQRGSFMIQTLPTKYLYTFYYIHLGYLCIVFLNKTILKLIKVKKKIMHAYNFLIVNVFCRFYFQHLKENFNWRISENLSYNSDKPVSLIFRFYRHKSIRTFHMNYTYATYFSTQGC